MTTIARRSLQLACRLSMLFHGREGKGRGSWIYPQVIPGLRHDIRLGGKVSVFMKKKQGIISLYQHYYVD